MFSCLLGTEAEVDAGLAGELQRGGLRQEAIAAVSRAKEVVVSAKAVQEHRAIAAKRLRRNRDN